MTRITEEVEYGDIKAIRPQLRRDICNALLGCHERLQVTQNTIMECKMVLCKTNGERSNDDNLVRYNMLIKAQSLKNFPN